ncbi:hypothetical protein M0802_013927 [Mischocyttarus mexicanus]|nr:hypothetical protein M0802_013927 [Mischocyttarus mexicanus]
MKVFFTKPKENLSVLFGSLKNRKDNDNDDDDDDDENTGMFTVLAVNRRSGSELLLSPEINRIASYRC